MKQCADNNIFIISIFTGKQRHSHRVCDIWYIRTFASLAVVCSCGMMFTAETQVKRQKNGNVHVYDYYRCTRKSKTVACREPHVRAEALDKQLSALLLGFSLPTPWADKLRELMRKDELSEKAEYSANTEVLRNDTAQLSGKLQRLLDSYLDGDVERELYQDKRAEILGQKRRPEEKIEQTTLGVLTWVEPICNKQKCRRKRRPISKLPPRKHLACAPRGQRKSRPTGRRFRDLFRFGAA